MDRLSIYSLFLSILLTIIIMPWFLRLCYSRGLFDIPNERKVHKNNIPRLGGVVLILCSLLSFAIVLGLGGGTEFPKLRTSSMVIGAGMFVVYLIGMIDDFLSLSATFKFFTQFVAALVFPVCGLYIDNLYGIFGIYELHPWLGYALTVILCMIVVNAINLIDGIDGLSAGLCIIGLIVYSYFFSLIGNNVFTILASSFVGGLITYLLFNIWGKTENRTKTFMGDSGSLTLGFLLAYFGLKLSVQNPHIAPPQEGILIPWSVLFIPVMDLVRVAFSRILKGEHPFHPDKTHIHHLFIRSGLTQRGALIAILIFDTIIITCNLLLFATSINYTWILAFDVILYSIIIRWLYCHQVQECIVSTPETKEPSVSSFITKDAVIGESCRKDNDVDNACISIVVATYNSSATISDTLESILGQTYGNYEVLICDGLSKDNTIEIVESFRDRFGSRLKVFSEPDKGIYDAMNKGIDRATGTIVGILNSDDFYTSNNVLERIIEKFKTTPLLEAVYGDVHYVKPEDLNRTVRYYSSKWFRPRNMRMGFMPAHPSFYCLKDLYNKYGKYNLEFKVAADFDQLYRMLFMHRIRAYYIDMDFVTMRTGGASNSGLKSHLQILKDHIRSMHSYGSRVYYPLFAIRYLYKCCEVISSRIR